MKRLYYELEALLKYDQESFFTDKCNCNIIDKYKKEVNLICDRVQDVEKLKMLLSLKLNMPNVEIRFANHHLSHAISAYIFSKFDEALCVVCDGVGE